MINLMNFQINMRHSYLGFNFFSLMKSSLCLPLFCVNYQHFWIRNKGPCYSCLCKQNGRLSADSLYSHIHWGEVVGQMDALWGVV